MQRTSRQAGTSLVEVLVTIVITAIGLLGLAGMQSRLQTSEMESYQRAQALLLLEDMASRLTTNRAAAATYATGAGSPLGSGMTCPTTDSSSSLAEIDAAEWCLALQGAAELRGSATVGTMIGARGCVEQLPDNDYLVTVAWQGLAPLAAPPASTACAADLYDDGTACADDLCRRVVTTVVRVASLD